MKADEIMTAKLYDIAYISTDMYESPKLGRTFDNIELLREHTPSQRKREMDLYTTI
jgi:hypothetical protein